MSDISNAPKTDLILLSLLEIKICTVSQIRNYSYDSTSGAHSALKRLEKEKLVLSRLFKSSRESGYYLTQKGYTYLYQKYNSIFPNLFEKIPSNVSQEGYKKINGYIEHTLAVGDIYYAFSKFYGLGNFTWNRKEDCILPINDSNSGLYSSDRSNTVKCDALVKTSEYTYIIEADRGTETSAILSKKFNDYAEYLLKNISRNNWPVFIFYVSRIADPIVQKYKSSSEISALNSKISELNLQIKDLESLLSKSKTDNNYLKTLKSATSDEIVELKSSMEYILQEPFINLLTPYASKNIAEVCSVIRGYLANDQCSIEEYTSAVSRRNKKQLELNQLKENLSSNRVMQKEVSRCEAVMSILKQSNLKSLFLMGLNFYCVNSFGLPSLMQKLNNTEFISPLDKCAFLLKYISKSYLLKNGVPLNSANIGIRSPFSILAYQNTITASRAIDVSYTVNGANKRDVYMIDDISCSNYGGILRVEHILKYFDTIKNEGLLLVCIIIDNTDQMKKLSTIIRASIVTSICFITLEDLDTLNINNINENNFWSAIEGKFLALNPADVNNV
jgi:hypothetical protein